MTSPTHRCSWPNVSAANCGSLPWVLPAAGATVLVGPPMRDLGGKGANQAIVLYRATSDVRFVATIGDDDAGQWIVAELSAEGFDTSHLIRIPGASDRSLIFV